jgi:DNA mismatch repair protein MutL
MGKIVKLDDSLSNLIAAGEVVENMASVVKELVENSIDAGSTDITVELKDFGLKEIRVTDNGEGMEKEDMFLSLERHATSKIRSKQDLFHIHTLGFRGEALPSIAAVSELEMISSNGADGYRLVIKNGNIIEKGEQAPKKGTSIRVKSLFYNTPARLKHLRSKQTELSYIVDYMGKMALSRPDIRFQLIHEGKILLSTFGNNDVLQVLSNLYPIDLIKDMVPFEGANGYFHIKGFLAKPEHHRSNRKHVTLIANSRMIRNHAIVKAVVDAYRTYLPVGKYPIVYLAITLDALLIDVNVHPSKLEVKFTEEKMLRELITKTIHNVLKSLSLIPSVSFQKEQTPSQQQKLDFVKRQSESETFVRESDALYKITPIVQSLKPEKQKYENNLEKVQTDRKKLPRLEYVGQVLGTYLVAQNEEGMYLIDQHAAAERIRYEKYRKLFGNIEIETQPLLVPMKLYLSKQEILALSEKLEALSSLGIFVKLSTDNEAVITDVPTWFPTGMELEYAEEVIKNLLEDGKVSVIDSRDQLAKDLACKHSIKANKYIDDGEIRKLLDDLSACENPYTCPHGRPVIIHFSVSEIEKLFKRIQS